jgi:hypothetical protein
VLSINSRQRLDTASHYEIRQGGLADPYVTAELVELDPA